MYVDLQVVEGTLVASSWNESTYVVDPESGTVELRYSRWDEDS